MDSDLAQELILDHDQRPRNYGESQDATHKAHGYSALCGDSYEVSFALVNGEIENLCFHGFGCAISMASASIMTEQVSGLSPDEARAKARDLEQSLLGSSEPVEGQGELAAFFGLRKIPTRAGCALLPWRTLVGALDGRGRVEVL